MATACLPARKEALLGSGGPDNGVDNHNDPARVWLPELVARYARFLPPNHTAASLRLVSRATRAALPAPAHTRVRLSQPVPPHAFAAHWGAPGGAATRGLTLAGRRRLVALTAATGVLPNLAVALAAADCAADVGALAAAAAAGQLGACRALRAAGAPCTAREGRVKTHALTAAAEAGQREACEWLLEEVVPGGGAGAVWAEAAVRGAARGGHEALTAWLLGRRPPHRIPPHSGQMLLAAAAGLGLEAVLRMEAEWALERGRRGAQAEAEAEAAWAAALANAGGVAPPPPEPPAIPPDLPPAAAGEAAAAPQQPPAAQGRGDPAGSASPGPPGPLPPPPRHVQPPLSRQRLVELDEHAAEYVLQAAAGSPTPDWAGKVAALQRLGYPAGPAVTYRAAERPDAPARLALLAAAGHAPDEGTAAAAARAGNAEALRLVLDAMQGKGPAAVHRAAPGPGDPLDSRAAAAAAAAAGAEAFRSDGATVGAAAASGSVEVLSELRARGFPVGPAVLHPLAAGGHLPALAWLLAQPGVLGPRMPLPRLAPSGLASAAAGGSLAALAWLEGRSGVGAVDAAGWALAAGGGCVAALEWLAERGSAMGEAGVAYLAPAAAGDHATLRCLAALGCPWGLPGRVLAAAVHSERGGAGVPTLTLMLALGCPPDWEAAARAAARRLEAADDGDEAAEAVAAWVRGAEEAWRGEQGTAGGRGREGGPRKSG
ncbi:hypothetical protein HYH03_018725 [Edaphochlamys debaryana]|uniref:Uncharacterized protein n=1 Tax=Edaphochlamys debaryana TaxID=47281 RepID=A0A836BN14_9CHLO|nr:hypothetical protein HYH03_018725 [Edaphochlamys debaryana]|eukprot:KAG2482337.1 hypothetical protein HYH03_018725 [Edaphochlamys debaryana]